MKYICVFCGSSEEGSAKYADVAKKLGKAMVENGYGLVYGGGNVGLMRMLADSVKAAGGDVIGVVTPEVIKLGVVHEGITLIEEPTYSARKAKMAALSDGFIALPGGYGTLDEFTEIAISNQFASYKNTAENPVKPCSVLNVDGFYDGLLQQVARCLQEKFITKKHFEMLYSANDPQDIVRYIANFKGSAPDESKWWEKSKEEKVASQGKVSSWLAPRTLAATASGGALLMGLFAWRMLSNEVEGAVINSVSKVPKLS